ncbi:hypothetical protein J416_03186 [Gracilibacillus halophilus YIM-C55.5]|uniref:Uncharacterized protein n=1 Tax=Gracilibacillus halophilus YIM-C55.5 TaxID=1308866 RepID=N4WP69_9BACI|nr:hypothetical protein [Gracilibacillus halophilus]ENH97922.1 hypothetical protein J416_03186 [Gracilibacillus halophilus YIM-C55.5]
MKNLKRNKNKEISIICFILSAVILSLNFIALLMNINVGNIKIGLAILAGVILLINGFMYRKVGEEVVHS